ncbi:hypothetical protein BX667DRAFT_279505 [Coemansia mojavensis]|nr:hypothetical protein BX667DRAFT_279505 [Coemansia mojavensis]
MHAYQLGVFSIQKIIKLAIFSLGTPALAAKPACADSPVHAGSPFQYCLCAKAHPNRRSLEDPSSTGALPSALAAAAHVTYGRRAYTPTCWCIAAGCRPAARHIVPPPVPAVQRGC